MSRHRLHGTCGDASQPRLALTRPGDSLDFPSLLCLDSNLSESVTQDASRPTNEATSAAVPPVALMATSLAPSEVADPGFEAARTTTIARRPLAVSGFRNLATGRSTDRRLDRPSACMAND